MDVWLLDQTSGLLVTQGAFCHSAPNCQSKPLWAELRSSPGSAVQRYVNQFHSVNISLATGAVHVRCTCLLGDLDHLQLRPRGSQRPRSPNQWAVAVLHTSRLVTARPACAAWFQCSSHKSDSHNKQQNTFVADSLFHFPFLVPCRGRSDAGAEHHQRSWWYTGLFKYTPAAMFAAEEAWTPKISRQKGVRLPCWPVTALSQRTDPKRTEGCRGCERKKLTKLSH